MSAAGMFPAWASRAFWSAVHIDIYIHLYIDLAPVLYISTYTYIYTSTSHRCLYIDIYMHLYIDLASPELGCRVVSSTADSSRSRTHGYRVGVLGCRNRRHYVLAGLQPLRSRLTGVDYKGEKVFVIGAPAVAVRWSQSKVLVGSVRPVVGHW